MKSRILTALLLIPPVIYLIGWSPKWLLLTAVIAAVELCLYEFFKMCLQGGFSALSVLAYLAGAGLCLVRAADTSQAEIYSLVVLFAFLLISLTVALALTRDLQTYLGAIATTVLGVAYIAMTLSCLLPLRFSRSAAGGLDLADAAGTAGGRKLMLLLFLVLWADDTFAYLVGRTVGRKKPFPSISPNKTVEGSVAGFVGSLLVGWGFAHLFWHTASVKMVILLTGLVALSGQIGDLVESGLKRGAHVKDSGSLLPGHGGLLDRVDSLLFGAPVLWLALVIKGFWR